MLRILLFHQKQCLNIYYHFWRDHESSGFQKLAVNKWICRKLCHYFLIKSNLILIYFRNKVISGE